MKTITKRILAMFLVICTIMSLSVAAIAASFTDVPESHWANEFVEKAAANNLVSGVGNGAYQPEKSVSNAEWCQMIANLYGSSISDKYDGDPWWLQAVVSAHKAQYLRETDLIVNGFNEDLNMDYGINNGQFSNARFYNESVMLEGISRYDMAQTIYNLTGRRERNRITVNTTGFSEQIADYASVPERFREAVLFCYATGFITGVDSNGTFAGSSSMTRGAAATVLCRLLDEKNGNWEINVNTNVEITAVKDMISITNSTRSDFTYDITVNNTTVPGMLSNGKPITQENIAAMLAEIEELFPTGTSWGEDETKHDVYYYNSTSPAPHGGGCNAFAGMVADVLFGAKRGDGKWTSNTNLYDAKSGDLIELKDSNGVSRHWIVVTGAEPYIGSKLVATDGGKYIPGEAFIIVEHETIMLTTCDGNNGAKVDWSYTHEATGVIGRTVDDLLSDYPNSILYSAY
ncbi:S-layer homology domain-containing protein [Oscillospiraceae bacterium OttesenSCG-928-F05]|nr:S-layer homology domain-containing protein [Oscillospiraceae bacterium OttesenSCG-928-F05]